MKKHFTFATIVFLSGLILAGPHTAMAIPPTPCQTMLKPFFEWSQKGQIGGSGDTKEYAVVYATVTQHTRRADSTEGAWNIVYYAAGDYAVLDPKTLALRWNSILYLNGNHALFAKSQLSDVINISQTGNVSVQRQAAGKNFLGRGPTNFVGTCYYNTGDKSGLITAFLDDSVKDPKDLFFNTIGTGVYTITLLKGTNIGA